MSEIQSAYGAFAVGWWKTGLFIPEFWFGTCETWFNGTVKRAFTANKWSRRAIKLFTCSSKRMFSERSWCKHDNNDATENNSKFISFVSIKKFQIYLRILTVKVLCLFHQKLRSLFPLAFEKLLKTLRCVSMGSWLTGTTKHWA